MVLMVGALNVSPAFAAAAAEVPVVGGVFRVLTVRNYQETNEDRTLTVEQPVVEGESAIYYKDFKYKPVGHHEMAILQTMPNVLMTPHTAFFTDEAVGDMVRYSIEHCVNTVRNGR